MSLAAALSLRFPALFPPPHVRPARQLHAEESAGMPPRRRPEGYSSQRATEVWAPTPHGLESIPHLPLRGPRSHRAAWRSPPQTHTSYLEGHSLHLWLSARPGPGARTQRRAETGALSPRAARGGGREAASALVALHMRRYRGCSPSQGPLRSGPSVFGTTFPISPRGRAVRTLGKVFVLFSRWDER